MEQNLIKKMGREKNVSRFVKVLVGIVLLVMVSGVSGCGTTVCEDSQCFIEAANECKSAELEVNEEAGKFKYTTDNCEMIKTLVSLDESEAQEMKDLLEGKSFSCEYEEGNFNSDIINSLVLGLEDCEGELKEIFGNLLVFS